MEKIKFIDNNGTFVIENPENYSGLYLPLAGEKGLKSSITPTLSGDSKTDQNHFLFEPVSIENLHNNKNGRNFWCRINGKDIWSVSGASAIQEAERFSDTQDDSRLEAGFMWQKLTRTSKKYGLKSEVLSFVPADENIEIMYVTLENISDKNMNVTPIAAFPVYGRSADNLRDHRHVTSLLHRIYTKDYGIEVSPILSFDERGHRKNDTVYFVYGSKEDGSKPKEFYPTNQMFIGEGGSFLIPEAVRKEIEGVKPGSEIQGKEAAGAFAFEKIELKSGEKTGYIVVAGITEENDKIEKITSLYRNREDVLKSFQKTKKHWTDKVNIDFEMNNEKIDNYLKWICFQPILRRIYGCSFLPYHDYGKGGRGWRDLWQDCLALLVMEPDMVRKMIVSNYGGVRIDGTNATIIGSGYGEFIADRNNITRVWMDHAYWPFVTTKLYIDQTGDLDILLDKVSYFKDRQSLRGTAHDDDWDNKYGNRQKTSGGADYFGTVIEHILLQNLCAFYDVGEHNEMRLHGADWNDALDMAWERGESVAFTCAYAGNLKDIAYYLRKLEEKTGICRIEMAKEMKCLFESGSELYESVHKKQSLLKEYISLCSHNISGESIVLKISQISENLEEKAQWLMKNISENEWIKEDAETGWFNGYYDNHGKKVEHYKKDDVRMMLTSQVFAIMSGTASENQIRAICNSADKYLYDKKAGGYRLNTDFREEKFDLGRMFGFAYGEKENGAVFSHMAVMYANALYKRGFIREGYKVLKNLLESAMDFENSVMYPGIPEYFDNDGRGLYAYLTGAASWYMLTMITEVFGVKGELGNLSIKPALLPEQFGEDGKAAIKLKFAGRTIKVIIHADKEKLQESNGKYSTVINAECDGKKIECIDDKKVIIMKKMIEEMSLEQCHEIDIFIK
ncbi:cellobiose phosphorylase [Eubacterium sp. MSJ-13]|uniref:GH36-type glycosyl hydrolase domain-containing protein n=1 Tax=Eubacterium sp. MSJ-13 TaxID=2841513 RepID=UPI001C107711|nr:cellobiose phosphorylase [Eubacterium sp. MSJ-13]MBU5477993.1 cellobiose phosphorylase [Eubacterium sp. MSJ-13]